MGIISNSPYPRAFMFDNIYVDWVEFFNQFLKDREHINKMVLWIFFEKHFEIPLYLFLAARGLRPLRSAFGNRVILIICVHSLIVMLLGWLLLAVAICMLEHFMVSWTYGLLITWATLQDQIFIWRQQSSTTVSLHCAWTTVTETFLTPGTSHSVLAARSHPTGKVFSRQNAMLHFTGDVL